MRAGKRTGRRLAAVVASSALVATGCGSTPPTPTGPRVAIVVDGAIPDARAIVTPAVLAAELGLREAGIEPWVVDVGQDPAGIARAVAADARVVGAIVAPFTRADTAARLVEAGVPVVSLSQEDPPAAAGIVRMGPTGEETRAAIAGLAGDDACLLTGQDPWAVRAAEILAAGAAFRRTNAPAECGTIVLSASADAAAAVRTASEARLVLTDQARTTGFIAASGPGAGPTWGLCGCVDPGSDVDPALQTFVHAYQVETGLDPGPYAAEAFDAATILAGSATKGRTGVAAALATLRAYDGVAGVYRWGADGVLIEPGIRTYVAEGVRWVPA